MAIACLVGMSASNRPSSDTMPMCGLGRSLTDRYREILDDLDERVIFFLDP
jgi:hypothetical protein